MPEYRGGSGSPIVLILVLLAVLIVAGVVLYLLFGSNPVSPAAETVDPVAPAPVQPVQPVQPAIQQEAPPVQPQEQAPPPQSGPQPFQPPEVLYGEILAEGFVDLQITGGGIVRTFYTFQVDTSTQNIVLFYALYDPTGLAISRSVVVEDYSQSELIDNAQLTVYYPDAPATVIRLDKESGTVESSQFYTTQPHGPGLFSSQMRIALIKQNLPLVNSDGSIAAAMQLDPTGVADLSGYRVTIQDAATTQSGLDEVQAIIDQLESRRPRS